MEDLCQRRRTYAVRRPDDVEASYRITAHLIDQGYSRIAVIGRRDDPPHATAVKRLKGYQKALWGAGLRYGPRLADLFRASV